MIRLVLCLSFVLAGGVRADEKQPELPKAPPYSEGTTQIQGESLVCTLIVFRYEPRTQSYKVIEAGKAVERTRTVYVGIPTLEKHLVPLKAVTVQVVGAAGGDPTKALQPFDVTKLPQALPKDAKVFFIKAGQKLEADALKMMKQGALILTLPKPEPPREEQRR